MRILDLIDLNYGDTLKQGDSTRLRFQLSARDYLLPDNEGKQARIVFHFNNSIVHEEYSTVQRGNVVEFSINEILPPNVYVLEIHVDGQIFPSDDYIFKIKLSAAGIDHEITKSYGINNIIERAVDLVSAKFINLTKEKLGLGNVINVKQASEVEVSQARGSYATLAERLNETDNKRRQTDEQLSELSADVLLKPNRSETGWANLDTFDENTRAAIQGIETGQINAVLGLENVKSDNVAKESITESKTSFIKAQGNLFKLHKTKFESGRRISGLTGETSTDRPEYSVTDFVPIESGLSYWYGGSGSTNVGNGLIHNMAWYDKDKQFISGNGGFTEYVDRPLVAPSNAKFIRLSFLTNAQANPSVPLYLIQSSVANNETGYKANYVIGSTDSDEKYSLTDNIEMPDSTADFAMVNGSEPVIVDFKNMEVKFSHGVYSTSITHKVITRTHTHEIPKNTRVTIDISRSPILSIVYNVDTKSVRLTRWSDVLKHNEILIGLVDSLHQKVIMLGDYRIIHTDNYEDETYNADVENPLGYNLEDISYSWWISPLAISYTGIRDKTYLGYTTSTGHTGVASINNDDGQVVRYHLKQFNSDDHNASSVSVRDDGRLLAAFSGGHNRDHHIHIRISKKPESVEEWLPETAVYVGGRTTYAQTIQVGGIWYVFFRLEETSWQIIKSEDDGVSWSDPIPIVGVESGLYYCNITETADDNVIRLVIYGHPNGNDNTIRMGFLDFSTGNILDGDATTVIGSINQSSYIPASTFTTIITPEIGNSVRLLDVAKTPISDTKILYNEFNRISTHDIDNNYISYDNGVSMFIVKGGNPFQYSSNYVGGMVFDMRDSNYIYTSTRRDVGGWFIEQWKYDSTNAEWNMIKEIASGWNTKVRPTFTKNGNKLFWQEGSYTGGVGVDTFQQDIKYAEVELS